MGIAFAALIGGFITPFGHSLNILCAGLLTSTYGVTIGFFEWVIPGLIIALIMIPVLWLIICKVFPPEELTPEEAALVADKDDAPMTALDKKSLVYMIVLVANANVIMVMLAVAFVPGIDILTWKEFQDAEGWGVVLMVGGVMCMANAAASTGAAAYMVNLFLNSGIMGLNILVALIIIMAVAYVRAGRSGAVRPVRAAGHGPVRGFGRVAGHLRHAHGVGHGWQLPDAAQPSDDGFVQRRVLHHRRAHEGGLAVLHRLRAGGGTGTVLHWRHAAAHRACVERVCARALPLPARARSFGSRGFGAPLLAGGASSLFPAVSTLFYLPV